MTARTLLLAALLLPALAQARPGDRPGPDDSLLPYSYLEGRYVSLDVDESELADSDGFLVGMSAEVGRRVFLRGSYQATETDELPNGTTVESTVAAFGVGFRFGPPARHADFVAGVQALFLESEVEGDNTPGGETDETGVKLDFGVRALVAPFLELRGGVNLVQIFEEDDVFSDEDDDDTEIGFDAGLAVLLGPAFALVGGAEFSDDATTSSAGIRFNF